MGNYSPNALNDEVPYGKIKIDGYLDNYMVPGAKIEHVVLSFKWDSRFWKIPPPKRDSVIILGTTIPVIIFTELCDNPLSIKKSKSIGGNYPLEWLQLESKISSRFVRSIVNQSHSYVEKIHNT